MKYSLKSIYLIFAAVLFIIGYSCNNGAGNSKRATDRINSKDTAVIRFNEYEHDFGKITEGEKVSSVFTFENTGKGPLVILSVTTSCGCTVPKYDLTPIDPGKTGSLEVVFDSSGKTGIQNKTITVKSNASRPIVLLRISGEVINSTNN